MDTPPPVVPAPLNPIRADLLSSAIQFLTDGAVNTAPLSTKIAFLEGKGLSKEEIELALLKADNSGSLNTIQQGYSIKGFLITSALILGTGSLILSNYTTIKETVKGWLNHWTGETSEIKRVERELKESIKELKELMEAKEQKLQDALNKLK